MPAGPIEQQHGMGAAGDGAADLVQMGLHGVAIGGWHHQRRPGSLGRAYGDEQIGALVALVVGLARP